MKKLKIGVIVGTHGLKGELKIKSFSDFNELRFKKDNRIFINYNNIDEYHQISSYREHKGLVLVTLKDLLDINLVEKYVSSEVFIEYTDTHKLEKDEVYFFELMGCKVFDDKSNFIGEVIEVIETGANAILRVKDEKEVLIPYVNAFIKNHDVDNKEIIINKMEGLL